MISTPGRARTDTGALLGGSPLPLGYGGAKIVPQLALFIQTFPGIGQVTPIGYQIDIRRPKNCAVAHAIGHCYYTASAGTVPRWLLPARQGSGDPGHAARPLEDGVQHRAGDPAGECVLLTRVIATEDNEPGQPDLDSVAECGARYRDLMPHPRELSPSRLPGEMTEADDDPEVG